MRRFSISIRSDHEFTARPRVQSASLARSLSSDLMYEDAPSGRVIHRNDQNWIQNLVTDIARNLQLSAP